MSHAPGFLVRLLSIALCGAGLAGCGGSAPVAHDGSGGATASRAVDGQVEAKKPDPNAMDLRKLPPLDNVSYAVRAANRIEGVVGGKAAAIFNHYREALEQLGWKLHASSKKDQVTDQTAGALLVKGEESILIMVGPIGMSGTATRDDKRVSISYLGSCDCNKLPRLPGAEEGFGDTTSAAYFTDMKAPATLASVRNMLVTAGWQEYKPLAVKIAMPNSLSGEFRKNGNSLVVTVSSIQAADDHAGGANTATKTMVKYEIGAIAHQLPAPPEATDVAFDDAMWSMSCVVPHELEPAAKYYINAMTELGYAPQRDLSGNDYKMTINCVSDEGDYVIVKLNCDGLNTHAALQGVSAVKRK